jgi:hypothetical protein
MISTLLRCFGSKYVASTKLAYFTIKRKKFQ